jgi:hypothetical protein
MPAMLRLHGLSFHPRLFSPCRLYFHPVCFDPTAYSYPMLRYPTPADGLSFYPMLFYPMATGPYLE